MKKIVTLLLIILIITTGMISVKIANKERKTESFANESFNDLLDGITVSDFQDGYLVTCHYYYDGPTIMANMTVTNPETGEAVYSWKGPLDEADTKTVVTHNEIVVR